MSIRVVHLNDAGVWVSDRGEGASADNAPAGTHYSSPGFSLIDPPRIVFGVDACAQSRLYPLSTHHQFWHRLDMEPFSRPVAHFRHNADIAFSHLQEIARDTELDQEVIMLVPGSFSRQQLAVLLGLAKQCPFEVVALIDAGLTAAAAAGDMPAQGLIHVELQLHQVVLTRVKQQGDEIARDTVAVVPAAGRVQMTESVLQLMTSAFVQQCRFNPQHNARSEQFLFDCLPEWLDDDALRRGSDERGGEEVGPHTGLISLEHNDTVHRARISPDSMRSRLAPYYQKIALQLSTLDPEQHCPLVVSPSLARLPGFNEHFRVVSSTPRDIRVVTVAAMADSCLTHVEQLAGNTESVRFHTRLRPSRAAAAVVSSAIEHPSHLLSDHRASRLRDRITIKLGDTQAEIIFDAGHYLLRHAATGVLINGVAARDGQRLQLGDSISASGSDQHLQLIRVEDGKH